MRIVYDEDYDYYENLMCKNAEYSQNLFRIYSDFFAVGTETDPMGSTRPDMNWHSTHGDRDNSYPGEYIAELI